MKFALNPRIQKLILAAALSTGLGFVTPTAYAQSYFIDLNSKTITNLDGSNVTATGINDAGQVVGFSDVGSFITGPKGIGMTDLEILKGQTNYAYGINDAGQVVGYTSPIRSAIRHAFITGPNGAGMTDLGAFGGDYSDARGINTTGQVVGIASTEDSPGTFRQHAFITGPNGVGMTIIDTRTVVAASINDTGQVVGGGVGIPGNAFITGANGVGMTVLGTLGGDWGNASAINDTGQVAGNSYTATGHNHAFILLDRMAWA
jgi:probable HAF family extracellular repeat protein